MNALMIAALLTAAPQATQDTQAPQPPQATSSAVSGANAAPAAGTLPLSLEEARAEGRKNTQALLALLDLERSEVDVRLSRAPLLPQLRLAANCSRCTSVLPNAISMAINRLK